MTKWICGAANAAKILGISVRHFRKFAEDNDIEPIVFEIGVRRRYFWLMKDLLRIKRD